MFRSLAAVALALSCIVAAPPVDAQTMPDEKTIGDAWTYLMARAFVVRQEHTDLKEPGVAFNTIKYNPLGSADFVNPNFDVAYLEAWFAVDDKTAVLLEVPQVEGRSYTAQLLDEWGEVIANINERTMPSRPWGKFALVKPGSTATIPPDAARLELHSSKAKMLGRVELKGDPGGAVRLQRAFKATALGTPAVAPAPALDAFDNKGLIGAALFDAAEPLMQSALDVMPRAAEHQQKVRAVARYVGSGAEARAAVDKLLRDKVIPQFQEYALTQAAPRRNHWTGAGITGNYGSDFRLRTSVNFAGLWANNIDEVIYFVATRDSEEKPLSGSNSYVMTFPPDRLPSKAVDGYWSVILVGVPDYRVVANPLNRYNFNNHSPLKAESDGSLKIGIGPKPVPGVPESNWLPSAEGKPFSLTFRTYLPRQDVKDGKWQPAAVTPVK
jgi:hypothetical protein